MRSYVQSAVQRIYDDEDDLLILGLTGRTGSGCTSAAKILCTLKDELGHSLFADANPLSNEQRKQRIVSAHFKKNWRKFTLIQVRAVITLLVLEKSHKETFSYFKEIKSLHGIEIPEEARLLFVRLIGEHIQMLNAPPEDQSRARFEFYFNALPNACDALKRVLPEKIFVKLYQIIGKNLRLSGDPYKSKPAAGKFYSLVEKINELIEIGRKALRATGEKAYFVIDALRNPFEAMFFQERYANFYLVAISCPDKDRVRRLSSQNYSHADIESLDSIEYSPVDLDTTEAFVAQDIRACLQKADLYISNPDTEEQVTKLHGLANQLIMFVSLMQRPGLVTPSHIERCMQMAYTAKLNSGCISRQVGAVVTDAHFSVHAIGWNDVPFGQVPCNLRDRLDLEEGRDTSAYSTYEKGNSDYLQHFKGRTVRFLTLQQSGRSLSFCFKAEYNSLKKDKNQVHTRSLHAEENAFLQVAKYGGRAIEGGMLFTTASPCELCSKKAYQLGIREIFYVDPYPGIAVEHVLQGGKCNPTLTLFFGAIGKAFHKLYSPIMPYKDELAALTAPTG